MRTFYIFNTCYYFLLMLKLECHGHTSHIKSSDQPTTSSSIRQLVTRHNSKSINPAPSWNHQESLFIKRCSKKCTCSMDRLTKIKKLKCKSFMKVKQLMEEFTELELQPLELTIQDSRIQKVYGNCGSDVDNNGTVCFALKKHFSFKAVHRLTLDSLPHITEIGSTESDFFSLMPNLKSLTLKLKTRQKVSIYFTYVAQSIQNLTLILSRDQNLQIGCSSKTCFKSTISFFYVLYSTNSSLQFLAGAKLPHSIKDLRIKLNKYTIMGNNVDQNLFAGIKTKSMCLQIKGDLPVTLAMNFTDVSVKRNFILKWNNKNAEKNSSSTSEYYPSMIYPQLRSIYQNYKLSKKLFVKSYWAQYYPAIISSKESSYKKSFFDTCRLTKEILEYNNITQGVSGNGKKLHIRAIHYDLSLLVRHSLLKEFDEIVVTAFSVYISETFVVPNDKLLTVYHFQVNREGGKEGSTEYHSVLINLNNHQGFFLEDLNVKAIPFKYAQEIDPVFTRGIALCVTQNVGAFEKRKAGAIPHMQLRNKEFSKVSSFIPTKITFDSDYGISEQASAWEALRNMNMYIGMIVENNNHLIRMSDVVLKPLHEGNFVFSRYAKKLSQVGGERLFSTTSSTPTTTATTKEFNVDDSLTATTERKEALRSSLWVSLDHSYHVISALKRKVQYIVGSHTDSKILFDDLILKFNTYKQEVQQNNLLFSKILKETNSFQTSKIVTGIVNATLELFEDDTHFEKIVKELLEDWVPSKSKIVIEALQDIRKLLLNLDSISVSSTKMKKAIENSDRKFEKYVDGVCKILDRIMGKIKVANQMNSKQKRQFKRLAEIAARLNSLKDELLWPDQIVKAVLDINKAIKIGSQLGGKYLKFFNLIPDPYQYFIPNKEHSLYAKSLKIDVDQARKWSVIRTWMDQTLNSTTAAYMIRKLEVRYPLLNLMGVANQITALMTSLWSYQVNLIDAQFSYLTYFSKAIGIRLKLERMAKSDNDENQGNVLKVHLRSETMTLKLELISWIDLYCKAFFYKHLQHCPVDFSTSIVDSLDDVFTTYTVVNEQFHIILQNEESGTIQSFSKQLSFTVPPYCRKCFKDIDTYQGHRVVDNNSLEKETLHMVDVACAEKEWSENHSNVTQTLQSIQEIVDLCLNNPIKIVKRFNSFSFTLSKDYLEFNDKDAVYLNKMEINLHGVTSPNNQITTYIATTGMYRATSRGETFEIYTEPLFLEYTYKYVNISKESTERETRSFEPNARSHIPSHSYDVNHIKSDIDNLEKSLLKFQRKVDVDFVSANTMKNLFKTPHLQKRLRSDIAKVDIDNIKMTDMKNHDDVIYSADLSITVDGVNLPSFGYTTWTILIARDKNIMLNLDQITALEISVSGTFKPKK